MMRRMFFYGIFKDRGRGGPDWVAHGARRVDGYTLYASRGWSRIGFARPKEGAHVEGALYDVPEHEVLTRIDRTEGHPYWYKRTEVVTSDGEPCEMYVLADHLAEEMPEEYFELGPVWEFWNR